MILPRATCYNRTTRRYYYCRNAWSDWARWLVLGLIILGFFFLFFLCSCITARRRRRQGLTPYRFTGWAAPGQGGAQGPPAQYNANAPQSSQPYYQTQPNGGYGAPAPAYSAPPNNTNYAGGEAAGYYGQQSGIELQGQPAQPQYAYQPPPRAGETMYAPPSGPPPGKGDIIR